MGNDSLLPDGVDIVLEVQLAEVPVQRVGEWLLVHGLVHSLPVVTLQ